MLGATSLEDGGDTQREDELSGVVCGARSTGGMLVRLTTVGTRVRDQARVWRHADASPDLDARSGRSDVVLRSGW